MLISDAATSPIAAARALAALETADVVVTAAPVTDTVKVVADGLVVSTLERDALVLLTPPLALSATAAGRLPAPRRGDLSRWLDRARAVVGVALVDARG